jgi:hypothetical protein
MDARGYVTAEETLQALRVVYREDAETNLQTVLARALSDDLRPVSEKGRWRPHVVHRLGAAVAVSLLSVLLYFSLGAKP